MVVLLVADMLVVYLFLISDLTRPHCSSYVICYLMLHYIAVISYSVRAVLVTDMWGEYFFTFQEATCLLMGRGRVLLT